jgi:uroporphyrinogen-III decarboxylase
MLEPEICEKIAELQFKWTLRELDRIKASGVDGVLSVGDLGHTNSLAASPDIYRDIILKYHQKIYEECKKRDLYVLRHCCGHIWPIIDEIAETNDAYEGIQARAGMDIKLLKEKVGDRLALWGGILHENIHGGTTKDIRNDAIYTFKNAAKEGGLIMGSSHSLTIGASYDNVMEMKKCRDELGVYPMKFK